MNSWIIIGLIGLILFGLFLYKNKKDRTVDGFNNYQVFQDNINEVIFNEINPYPSENIDAQIPLPLPNFCAIYGSNNDTCGMLTDDNCKSSTCCVLTNGNNEDTEDTVSNPQCVGGSEHGPTFSVPDATSYYYMNQLYNL